MNLGCLSSIPKRGMYDTLSCMKRASLFLLLLLSTASIVHAAECGYQKKLTTGILCIEAKPKVYRRGEITEEQERRTIRHLLLDRGIRKNRHVRPVRPIIEDKRTNREKKRDAILNYQHPTADGAGTGSSLEGQ